MSMSNPSDQQNTGSLPIVAGESLDGRTWDGRDQVGELSERLRHVITVTCDNPLVDAVDLLQREVDPYEGTVSVERVDADSVAACRAALEAIAPCVVGWPEGQMPAWAEKLNAVVPQLQAVLGITPQQNGSSR